MRKVKRHTKRNTKRNTKCNTKSKSKSKRNTKRNTKSKRQAKRHTKSKRCAMKGGDYETSIVDGELELVPILADDSKDLSVSVPGFGTVGMKAYRQYMQDLDTRGSAQM